MKLDFFVCWTCNTCIGLSLENGMAFVGVDPNNFTEAQRDRMARAGAELTTAIVSIPIDMGKYSQFGRGMLARKFVIGALCVGV